MKTDIVDDTYIRSFLKDACGCNYLSEKTNLERVFYTLAISKDVATWVNAPRCPAVR